MALHELGKLLVTAGLLAESVDFFDRQAFLGLLITTDLGTASLFLRCFDMVESALVEQLLVNGLAAGLAEAGAFALPRENPFKIDSALAMLLRLASRADALDEGASPHVAQ